MATYAYIDVSRKQEFIYKHNKLRDNLHNSFIIKSVTEEMEEANVCADEVSLTAHLKKHHQAQSEVVYSGGGNSIVRFDTWGQGERFARGYSKEILEAHPDLELYISLVDAAEVDVKGEEQEKQIRQLLHAKADRLKEKRRARFRRWTYGVEKIDETGQAERSCAAQRQTGKQSKYYLHQRLEKELKNTKIEITDELQHYKKDEEGKSYIGVLVIDGNKMGEMAQRIDTFKQLAVFSGQVESIYAEAVIEALKACSDKRAEESPPLYITPVLMAGDDVCLITQAEHAIEIAADILKNINSISGGDEQLQPFLKGSSIAHLTACAGVAIARYTHPFFETVQAAETLCRRGKEMLHKRKDNGRAGASFINWEVLQAQVATEQASEERVESGRVREIFHIKPLCVEQEEPVSADGIYGYDTFIELAREIRREEAISNSLLEDWKKNLYSGWEQYKLFFNLRQGTRKLNETVQKFFGDHIRCAAWKIKDGPVTYILNDVLDVLPFMECQEGGGGHVVRAEP